MNHKNGNHSGMLHSPEGEDEQYAYHTTLEKKFRHVLNPFQGYIRSQTAASFFLLICTIIALVWASIPAFTDGYYKFVFMRIGFHINQFYIDMPLRKWVNDLLLTLFFFFVGLEIKREFLVGELTNRKRAVFICCAAVGGMFVPALIYFLVNQGTPTQVGWGIPMATDTAFALGILSCFRHKLPRGVFTFLVALAIIDDIGAIIVIAVYYTQHIDMQMLLIALVLAGILIMMNLSGFRRPFPYIFIGLFVWAAVEAANIHGTLAGILIAFIIPARPRKGPRHFIRKIKELLTYFERRKEETPLILEDEKQHELLEEMQEVTMQATTPLQWWQTKLQLPVALIVLPIFALVNAGIPINVTLFDKVFTNRVSIGIMLGLVIGKPLGVLLFSRIALWFKLGTLPSNTTFRDLYYVAFLTGIGFTMSLFIAHLSFQPNTDPALLAKGGILMSSLIASIIGIVLLIFKKPV